MARQQAARHTNLRAFHDNQACFSRRERLHPQRLTWYSVPLQCITIRLVGSPKLPQCCPEKDGGQRFLGLGQKHSIGGRGRKILGPVEGLDCGDGQTES
eukprot:scaffold69367_cov90-Cyclotella_meneghiniana.AAC.9